MLFNIYQFIYAIWTWKRIWTHIFSNTETTEDKMGKLQIRAEFILNSNVPRRRSACWDPTLCAGKLLGRSLIRFWCVLTS